MLENCNCQASFFLNKQWELVPYLWKWVPNKFSVCLSLHSDIIWFHCFFFSKIFWLKTTQYHGFIRTALRQLRPYFISHDCKEIFILILWQKTWLLIFNNIFIAPTYSVPKHCQPCMSLYDLHAQNHGFIHWLSMLLIRTLPCDIENELWESNKPKQNRET